MNDLVAFLTARLDEDEAAAKAAQGELKWGAQQGGTTTEWAAEYAVSMHHVAAAEYITRHDPARVLRDVEAKRRIVVEHDRVITGCKTCDYPWPCETLRLLALPYADHRDYDEDWKP